MPKILANGINLHYLQVGCGPDIVMLHGLTGNLAIWHLKIVRQLQAQFRVTTYDLRGHGHSDVPPTGYTTGVLVADLKGLLDALGLERVHMVGHSFGADIALHFALLYPERVAKLVVIEAGLASLVHLRKGQDWEGWKAWRDVLAEYDLIVPKDKWYDYKHMALMSLDLPKQFGPATGRTRKPEPLFRLLNETTVIEDYENVDGFGLDKIAEITTPTHLVYGENSAYLMTYRYLKEHLPNQQSTLLPASRWGHFGPLEQPELLMGVIKEFLPSDAHESAQEPELNS